MKTYDNVGTGKRVQEMRIKAGYSQEELGEIIGVGDKYFTRIERGVRACSVDVLMLLAQTLDTSVDYLVFGEERNDHEILKQQNQKIMKAMTVLEAAIVDLDLI